MALFKLLTEFGNHLDIYQQRKYITLGKPNSNGRKLVDTVEWVTGTKSACERGLQVVGEMHILFMPWMVRDLKKLDTESCKVVHLFDLRHLRSDISRHLDWKLIVCGREGETDCNLVYSSSTSLNFWGYVNLDLSFFCRFYLFIFK